MCAAMGIFWNKHVYNHLVQQKHRKITTWQCEFKKHYCNSYKHQRLLQSIIITNLNHQIFFCLEKHNKKQGQVNNHLLRFSVYTGRACVDCTL